MQSAKRRKNMTLVSFLSSFIPSAACEAPKDEEKPEEEDASKEEEEEEEEPEDVRVVLGFFSFRHDVNTFWFKPAARSSSSKSYSYLRAVRLDNI